ncbi:hypothetical protein GCM10007170_40240 [Arthrobacter liuii]|uniref:Uncharacterized protein n=1 Tax=Arthrobacter liuii TaxID=1476996 RepID=A0ABQ2B169_9MICC|nr:hypothetical protein GCM10007170_40240 [Arthrobacter liuii]
MLEDTGFRVHDTRASDHRKNEIRTVNGRFAQNALEPGIECGQDTSSRDRSDPFPRYFLYLTVQAGQGEADPLGPHIDAEHRSRGLCNSPHHRRLAGLARADPSLLDKPCILE